MFVTEVFLNNVYQSYVPRPLIPEFDKNVIAKFSALDKLISASQTAADFKSLCLKAVDNSGGRAGEKCISYALDTTFAFKRIREKQILKLNALITQKPESAYRQTPVWIGAPNPKISWHVGSPVRNLKRLMDDVFEIDSPRLPCSLRKL